MINSGKGPEPVARGGNYAKAHGLFRKKYASSWPTKNCPPPGQSLQIPGWANPENALRRGDPWGLNLFEGIRSYIFYITNPSLQEIKASWSKKWGVGLQDPNEQFIAQFEQKSAQIF